MATYNTSIPGPAMEILGRIAYEAHLMKPLLPTYLHLLVSAIFPIYIAAHASLSRPSSAAPQARKKGQKKNDDDEETDQKIEGLNPSDAVVFPVLAGVTLASLYFILKWLQDPAWLNWLLGIYFAQIGLFFATKFLRDTLMVLRSFVFPIEYSTDGTVLKADNQGRCYVSENKTTISSPFPGFMRHLPLPNKLTEKVWSFRQFVYAKAQLRLHLHRFVTIKSPITVLDVLALVIASGLVYVHTFIVKPWFLTNFLGFSFCYGSLQFMSPTTGWTGTLILSALFFYDIYFVFFTPMMVTVATKLDVPIKLLFPRPDGCHMPVGAPEGSPAMEEYVQCLAKKRAMAMLGLGDIVVPGMMLAFALRFDLYLYYLKLQKRVSVDGKEGDKIDKPTYSAVTGSWGERFWVSSRAQSTQLKAKRFPKTYFYATVLGYLAGMITTVVVMQVAAHAQPALLYLVPGVLISLWGTALVKGDLKTLWNYSEESEEEKSKKDKEEKKQDKSSSSAIENGSSKSKQDSKDSPQEIDSISQKAGQNEEDNNNLAIVNTEDQANDNPNNKTAEKGKKDPENDCRRLVYFSITLPESPSTSQVSTLKKPKPKPSKAGSINHSTTTTSSSSSISSDSDTHPTTPKIESSPQPTHSYNLRNQSSTSIPSSPPKSPLPDVKADHAVLAKLEKEITQAVKENREEGKGGEPPGKRRRKA